MKKTKKRDITQKFLLKEEQLEAIRKCHYKIIKDELIFNGVPQNYQESLLEGRRQTLEKMFEMVQKELLSLGEMAQMRKEILAEKIVKENPLLEVVIEKANE